MATSPAAATVSLRTYRGTQSVIARFIARRTYRSAIFWAVIFGVYVASKTAGFIAAYPTQASRAAVAATLGNNVGIDALIGVPHRIDTVAGYVAWNTLSVTVIIGAIWALLLATKTFRGEEDAGRWEVLLSGQTTAKAAAANALAGLGVCLLVLFAVTELGFLTVARLHGVGFGFREDSFFALAVVSGAAIFMSVGAFTSQLMPTRRRAAGLATAVFGVFFLLRAAADTTNLHWLLNVTPFGWIERLQPLFDSRAIWLLPIFALILALCGATIWLAGQRDLETSIFRDQDTAKSHTRWLNSPFGLAIRQTRGSSLIWWAAIVAMGLFYGGLAKLAVQALQQSGSATIQALNQLTHGSQAALIKVFLGFAFFMVMILLMAYAASAMSNIREDEAQGYLDNLVVNPISRWRWLFGRLSIILAMILLAGLSSAFGVWLTVLAQHLEVSFRTIMAAGLNILAPAVLVTGIGVLALGLIPRQTSLVCYGLIAWSFLVTMVGSGLHLNHWLLDTSLLQHINLAPATSANWTPSLVMLGSALILTAVGAALFDQRDLQTE